MAYAFNDDRSKVEVKTKAEIEQDYVKFDDTMTASKAGVAKIGSGLEVSNGALQLNGGDMGGAVADWLDDHPEATTTVQDNSLTNAKLIQTGGILEEVTNIRTGYDGTVYDSAGDAVRDSIDDVMKIAADYNRRIVRLQDLVFEQGIIYGDGAGGNVPGTINLAAGGHSNFISVKSGDVIDYCLYSYGPAYAAIGFYSLDYQYVNTLVPGVSGSLPSIGTVTVVQDGYIKISSNVNDSIIGKSYVYINEQPALESRVGYVEEKINRFYFSAKDLLESGNLIKASDGSLFALDNGYTTPFIPVFKGDQIHVKGSSFGTAYGIVCLYSLNKTFAQTLVNSGQNLDTVIEADVEIPSDGFIRFSVGKSPYFDEAYLIFNDHKDNFENRIGKLESTVPTIETDNMPAWMAWHTVGVIGDSYSAVRLYNTGGYPASFNSGDVPYYSWAKFMERISGMNYKIFAVGGYEAKDWIDGTSTRPAIYPTAILEDNLCQAYIIGLGINDCGRHDVSWVGSESDIDDSNPDNNADSFVGYYAKIVQKMTMAQPYAKFFVMTMPTSTSDTGASRYEAFNDGIRIVASHFSNVYLIDLYEDYYDLYHDSDSFLFNPSNGQNGKCIINGHYTPQAYAVIASIIEEEISKIMISNPEDFNYIEFIGNGFGI